MTLLDTDCRLTRSSYCDAGATRDQRLPHTLSFPAEVLDLHSGFLYPLNNLGLDRVATSLGRQSFEDFAANQIVERGTVNAAHVDRGNASATRLVLAGNVCLQELSPQLSRRNRLAGTYVARSEPLGAGMVNYRRKNLL